MQVYGLAKRCKLLAQRQLVCFPARFRPEVIESCANWLEPNSLDFMVVSIQLV